MVDMKQCAHFMSGMRDAYRFDCILEFIIDEVLCNGHGTCELAFHSLFPPLKKKTINCLLYVRPS